MRLSEVNEMNSSSGVPILIFIMIFGARLAFAYAQFRAAGNPAGPQSPSALALLAIRPDKKRNLVRSSLEAGVKSGGRIFSERQP
jgi:hypothetical protein